jgi:DNA repair protein RadA
VTELEAVTGVGPAVAKKLREVFVTTAELLAVQNHVDLQNRTKLGEGTALKIIRNARQLVGLCGFKSGLEIEQEMASKPRLSVGIDKANAALLGGIETGSIVEFYGAARSGKTQWCGQLAVMVQLPKQKGGLEGRVLWLDTESSFKPWIIRANAVRFGLDPDVTLGNIGHAHIVMTEQMTQLFENIPQLCAEQDYKLVVVDSLTGLFRAEYTGLELLRVRQQEMNGLLNLMRRTATATDTIFCYTNQVIASMGMFKANPNSPVGGHILSHASDYRFYVKKKLKDVRGLQLQDNAGIPEFDIDVVIGWGGFYPDSKTKKKHESGVLEYFRKTGWNPEMAESGEASEEEQGAEQAKEIAEEGD